MEAGIPRGDDDGAAADGAAAPSATGTDGGGLALALAGARVTLLAARALWWPDERTLFVADVHLGKAETFRALGVPVPAGPTLATLRRLDAAVRALGARRLVVLGDLLHARQAHAPATLGPLAAWRDAHPRLACVLVRGNHDDRAGDPPAGLGFDCVDAGARLGPFRLCHEPAGDGGDGGDGGAPAAGPGGAADPAACGHRLCGHQHPAVRLHGRAGDSVRLPCFVVGRDETVLPAFGDFTGASIVARGRAARLYAIAGDRVFALPAAGPAA